MIGWNKQQILKTQLKHQIMLKTEYKYIILRSIVHNLQLSRSIRLAAQLRLVNFRYSNLKQKCLMSGKQKSVNGFLTLSRHNINYFAKLGILQNFKTKS